jgi:hypothetical protein
VDGGQPRKHVTAFSVEEQTKKARWKAIRE